MPQLQFTSFSATQNNYLHSPATGGCSPNNPLDSFPSTGAETHTPPHEETDSPCVLVVDDAPDVTEMLAMMLRFSGFRVVAVFSAAAALAAARERSFNVIVSDIGMPGMNGYELARALRALPDYETVPLIALTGFSMYDDRDRALASGFDAFLTKPIDPSKLIEVIEQLQS